MMNKTIAVTIATAAALSLGASTPAWAELPGTTAVGDVIPALATAQASNDMVPDGIDLVALGDINPDSVRSLGSDDLASYWIGQSVNGDVCLISYIPSGNEVAGSSCAGLPAFQQSGLAMITGEDVRDPSRSTEAYYLPDGVDVSDLGSSRILNARVRPDGPSNFVSGRPGSLELHAVKFQRPDGTTFRFTPLTLPAK